jgi:hypothetical protein
MDLESQRGNDDAGEGQRGQNDTHGEEAFQIDDISALRDRMNAWDRGPAERYVLRFLAAALIRHTWGISLLRERREKRLGWTKCCLRRWERSH